MLILSYVYMLDFLNLEESTAATAAATAAAASSTRFRMGLYYAIVLIENVLLAALWSSSVQVLSSDTVVVQGTQI